MYSIEKRLLLRPIRLLGIPGSGQGTDSHFRLGRPRLIYGRPTPYIGMQLGRALAVSRFTEHFMVPVVFSDYAELFRN